MAMGGRGQSQGEMTRDAAKDFQKADAEMNAVYNRLARNTDAGGRDALREAQRAWLKFRDADARFRAHKGKGGSIYPMLVSRYLAELTRQRTEELKEAERVLKTEGEF